MAKENGLENLDTAIEKANKLVELLHEAQQAINSLSATKELVLVCDYIKGGTLVADNIALSGEISTGNAVGRRE